MLVYTFHLRLRRVFSQSDLRGAGNATSSTVEDAPSLVLPAVEAEILREVALARLFSLGDWIEIHSRSQRKGTGVVMMMMQILSIKVFEALMFAMTKIENMLTLGTVMSTLKCNVCWRQTDVESLTDARPRDLRKLRTVCP